MTMDSETNHGLLMEVLDAASSPQVCGKENPADALCAVLRERGLHVRRLVWIPEHQNAFELNCGYVADLVVGDSIAVFVDGGRFGACSFLDYARKGLSLAGLPHGVLLKPGPDGGLAVVGPAAPWNDDEASPCTCGEELVHAAL